MSRVFVTTTALALALAGPLACGPSAEDTDTASGTGDAMTTGGASTGGASSTGDGATTGDAATTDASAGSVSDATTTTSATVTGDASATSDATEGPATSDATEGPATTGGDTDGLECGAPQDVLVSFELTPEPGELDLECLVSEELVNDEQYSVTLSCDGDEYELLVASTPALPAPSRVDVGELIHLTYLASPDGRWLTLKQVGEPFGAGTVLAMVAASTLDPPGTTLTALLESPEVELVEGPCDPIEDLCGPLARRGLHFTYFEPGGTIYDHDHGIFGLDFVSRFEAIVERAGDLPTNACMDPPPRWYQFGFSWVYTGP